MANNFYGFDEPKKKLNILSLVEVIIIILCAVSIVGMITCFFLFSKDGATPKVFGNNIFVTKATNMEPKIPANSVIFSDPDSIDKIAPGSVVLVKISNEASSTTVILRVQQILEDQDGKASYVLKGDTNSSSETIKVSKDNIIGLCVKYDQFLGGIIVFATSQLGVLTAIIFPAILIIVLQVIHIIKIRNNDDDDDEEYYDEDTEIDDEEDVLFSTSNSDFEEEKAPVAVPPTNKLYVENDGKALFNKNAIPNSNYEEMRRSMYPSSPTRNSKMNEVSKEIHFETPNYTNTYSKDDIVSKTDRVYYEKKSSQEILEPPAVENPVAVTIPSEAVKPKETIAPPPKQSSNKTLEELMNMIDRAQNK